MSSFHDDSTISDATLVTLVLSGNHVAFDILFQRHKSGVHGYIRGLSGHSEDAYDLTQQTFLRAWESLSTLRNGSRFKTWLYTIARNLVYDQGRIDARISLLSWETLGEYHPALSDPGPEDETAEAELVRLTLAEVSEKCRDCLLLKVEGGFSLDEIAELTGLSKGSVSVYLSQARKQFREAYNRLTHIADASGERKSML